MCHKIITILTFLFFSAPLFSQDASTLQDDFLEAEYFFVNGDYQDALPYYLKLYEKVPDNANIAYRHRKIFLQSIKREQSTRFPLPMMLYMISEVHT
jgi:hypothetical protein